MSIGEVTQITSDALYLVIKVSSPILLISLTYTDNNKF